MTGVRLSDMPDPEALNNYYHYCILVNATFESRLEFRKQICTSDICSGSVFWIYLSNRVLEWVLHALDEPGPLGCKF